MWPAQQQSGQKPLNNNLKSALKKNPETVFEEEVDEFNTTVDDNDVIAEFEDISCASSVDSHTSSIFDQHSTCTKVSSINEDIEDFELEKKEHLPRKLKFNDAVMRRDIDSKGAIHESLVNINDVQRPRHHRRHHHRHHRHHHQQTPPRTEERIKKTYSEFDNYSFGVMEDDDIFYKNQVVF